MWVRQGKEWPLSIARGRGIDRDFITLLKAVMKFKTWVLYFGDFSFNIFDNWHLRNWIWRQRLQHKSTPLLPSQWIWKSLKNLECSTSHFLPPQHRSDFGSAAGYLGPLSFFVSCIFPRQWQCPSADPQNPGIPKALLLGASSADGQNQTW